MNNPQATLWESAMPRWRVLHGEALEMLRELPPDFVHCVVTSPPYWNLRDYGVKGQLGLEPTPEEWSEKLVEIFREVRRVLRVDGTCWVNLGDTWASDTGGGGGGFFNAINRDFNRTAFRQKIPPGYKSKDLVGCPWLFALAARSDGWYLRQEIIWEKRNPMPESPKDRPALSHEHVFLLTKSDRYWYDCDAVRVPQKHPERGKGNPFSLHNRIRSEMRSGGLQSGKTETFRAMDRGRTRVYHPLGRHLRSVWELTSDPFKSVAGLPKPSGLTPYPRALVRPCVRAGCPPGGLVLDPFCGSARTGLVALELGRRFIGIELNSETAELARTELEAIAIAEAGRREVTR